MKPAPFEYVLARSVAEAVAALGAAKGEGKVIAGGQSLMPMMNFRMVRPGTLVDINRIAQLDRIDDLGERIRIGATVRHRMVATDPLIEQQLPVLHEAMKHVAHLTVRNRGTFCGSLCHADPAAEMPMLALLLDGQVEIVGASGPRLLHMTDFLVSALTTDLRSDEIVTGVTLAKPAVGTGWGFEEFSRRHGDYALTAVAVLLERHEGTARNVRIALMGIGDTARRAGLAESVLEGRALDETSLRECVDRLRTEIEPNRDINGSAEYRRHLAGVLAVRALKSAWTRASEGRAA